MFSKPTISFMVRLVRVIVGRFLFFEIISRRALHEGRYDSYTLPVWGDWQQVKGERF